MKKSFLAVSILLILVSCKNIEKSNLLDSSSNEGKENITPNTNNNTPLQASNNENIPQPPIKETGIYMSADSTYHLKYVLEKGKTYSFNTKDINTQTVTFRGESQSVTQESTEPLSFTVIESTDGKYTFLVKMGGKKVITKADGQQFTFDTNGKKPENKDQAIMWKIYKALSDASFKMEMDIYGNVIKLSGMDAVYSKAKSALSGDLKGAELDEFIKTFKQAFNEQAFKAQFEASMIKFPSKGLKIGEKWNSDPSRKNQGYNQLVKVDKNTTQIKIQGSLPSQSDSQTAEGITYKISVSGKQNGTIVIDNQSGWISSANFSITATETKSAQEGSKSEKVITKTVNKTYIN